MPLYYLLILLLLLQSQLFADRGLKLLKEMKEEQRVALVIGNSNYTNLAKLKNPINDARSMKKELKRRGFEVIYKENATKRDMKKLVKSFTNKLSRGGVGLYYFAGHGINVEGNNYLVSVDSSIDTKEDVEYESYALNRITKKMQNAHNRLNIVILDACRNDPFSRGSSGGLAPIGDARGMFVAYATQAGNVAADSSSDGSGHGVFTNLIWQKGNSAKKMQWSDAKSYCSDLELDGYRDFRLPSKRELEYLADRSKNHPAIDTNYFNAKSSYYWSGSVYKHDSSQAWRVGFDDGNSNYNNKSYTYYVRCARVG